MENSALIFGCGYLGTRVAQRLIDAGWPVVAVTRSTERARILQQAGIEPIIANWTQPHQLRSLPNSERVLVAVGWDRSGNQSQHDNYVGGLRSVLSSTADDASLVYISSTGVYHQTDGSWVDESSTCRPAIGSGGWSHLKAEELLWRMRPGGRWTTLRMAGLYGPGRVPRAQQIKSGQPIAAATEGYLNLIHIDDAADAVMSAWESTTTPARTYVVSDGAPVIRQHYYEAIAEILNLPIPTFTKPNSRRPITNKRIWTARFRRELCPRLGFPDYRSGLSAILAGSS